MILIKEDVNYIIFYYKTLNNEYSSEFELVCVYYGGTHSVYTTFFDV